MNRKKKSGKEKLEASFGDWVVKGKENQWENVLPWKKYRTEKSRAITSPFTTGTNKIHESIYFDLAIYL